MSRKKLHPRITWLHSTTPKKSFQLLLTNRAEIDLREKIFISERHFYKCQRFTTTIFNFCCKMMGDNLFLKRFVPTVILKRCYFSTNFIFAPSRKTFILNILTERYFFVHWSLHPAEEKRYPDHKVLNKRS